MHVRKVQPQIRLCSTHILIGTTLSALSGFSLRKYFIEAKNTIKADSVVHEEPVLTTLNACALSPVFTILEYARCGVVEKATASEIISPFITVPVQTVVHYKCNAGFDKRGTTSYAKCVDEEWTSADVICVDRTTITSEKKEDKEITITKIVCNSQYRSK
ncbi:hypothetical protein DPMN_149967 [Dreissena polymorpha]|uniref:Sushi domain-containing protein n=1 Tax=Dreissena polymorpha TaxID=45954 RepID=A0A9D4J575_DREPO|nr:hypothetical protein DPMN_149967 [Dreissena polymorpha]